MRKLTYKFLLVIFSHETLVLVKCQNVISYIIEPYIYYLLAGVSVIDKQPTSSTAAIQIENEAAQNDAPPTSVGTIYQPTDDNFRKACLRSTEFEGKLEPGDIKLSSAMAMSAAAISPYLGKHVERERQATHILTVLGMEMAANTVYNLEAERKEKWYWQVRFRK